MVKFIRCYTCGKLSEEQERLKEMSCKRCDGKKIIQSSPSKFRAYLYILAKPIKRFKLLKDE